MEINNLKINLTVKDLDTNSLIAIETKQYTLMNTVHDWVKYKLNQYRRSDRSIQFVITNLKTNNEVQFAKVS